MISETNKMSSTWIEGKMKTKKGDCVCLENKFTDLQGLFADEKEWGYWTVGERKRWNEIQDRNEEKDAGIEKEGMVEDEMKTR